MYCGQLYFFFFFQAFLFSLRSTSKSLSLVHAGRTHETVTPKSPLIAYEIKKRKVSLGPKRSLGIRPRFPGV